eukprot:10694143-Alexandrium_andersonii.AAC.1
MEEGLRTERTIEDALRPGSLLASTGFWETAVYISGCAFICLCVCARLCFCSGRRGHTLTQEIVFRIC